MIRLFTVRCHFRAFAFIFIFSIVGVLFSLSVHACEGLDFRDFSPETAPISCSNAIYDGGFYIAFQQAKDGSYCSYIESKRTLGEGGQIARVKIGQIRNWMDYLPDRLQGQIGHFSTLNIRREAVFLSTTKDDYWFTIQVALKPTDHRDRHYNGVLDIWENGKRLAPKLYGPLYCDVKPDRLKTILK